MRKQEIVIVKPVESKILVLRGQKVILDSDLAELYGVTVKRLNQQVRRNTYRFPRDFVFQVSATESKSLRLQFQPQSPAVVDAATCLTLSPSTAQSWQRRC